MDAVAKTSEQWVAYKYDAGLGGFSTALTPRVTWRDTGGHPQQYAFGGVTNKLMAFWYHAHPRTKGTTGYPDLIFDKAWTKNDRYLGVAFKPGMGMDLSEARMCEWRCFDVTDTMNNLYAGSGLRPKYIIADIDTYQKGPEDDLYPNFPVNSLRLGKVPGPDEDWSPVLTALRNGDFS